MMKRQAGFSLIELLLVIGLIAIMVVAAFFVYPQVRDRNYVNLENQRLLQVAAVLKNLYVGKGVYTGLTTDVANQARAFSKEANEGNYAAGQEIRHIWGGRMSVAPNANPAFMDITYEGVPSDACQKLSTGVAANFKVVSIDGNVVWREADRLAMDVNAMVAACSAATGGATLVFTTN